MTVPATAERSREEVIRKGIVEIPKQQRTPRTVKGVLELEASPSTGDHSEFQLEQGIKTWAIRKT